MKQRNKKFVLLNGCAGLLATWVHQVYQGRYSLVYDVDGFLFDETYSPVFSIVSASMPIWFPESGAIIMYWS